MKSGLFMSEFNIIEEYFTPIQGEQNQVELGVGDDGALVNLPETHHLVVTTDMLIAGVHFPENTSPEDIACKALAVNLSDLAAMGANPRWFTLAISLPEVDPVWLKRFASSLMKQAEFYNISLIGGDTNKGPLSITIQALGQVPKSKALRRSTAKKGDYIYCTGTLGDAALGLAILQGKQTVIDDKDRHYLVNRLNCPTPRLGTGLSLRSGASAAIDISDGLINDLQHILDASSDEDQGTIGAVLNLEDLPLSDSFRRYLGEVDAWEMALAGGDDYELCFTVSEAEQDLLTTSLTNAGCIFTCIGRITGKKGIELQNAGAKVSLNLKGFDHFEQTAPQSVQE